MEVINKKHKSITVNQKLNVFTFLKVHNIKQIYFSTTATKEFGLSEGLYAHFVNDGDQWFMYFNTDTDGFALSVQKGRNVSIFNQALIQLFLKRTNHKAPSKFPLRLTGTKHEGHHLIEIMHKQPMG